jgi:hypothetical protein
MSYWEQNLCPNPSFETGLTGYTALTGTTLAQTDLNTAFGQQALQVTLDGHATGEGFYGPQSPAFSPGGPACLSVYLSGANGTVRVQAVINPGGTVLAQADVTLTRAWQRVTLTGLTIPLNAALYLLVTTVAAQAVSFTVDAVQYSPLGTIQPYIDGDQPGCRWLGTRGASTSVKDVQNPAYPTSGGLYLEGHARIIVPGAVFPVTPPSGGMRLTGAVGTPLTVSPVGAVDDFAVYEPADLDPAMTYCGWTNAGIASGHTSYSRPWAVFYPPLDYPVSDGSLLWPRAAYMATGFEFTSVPAGAAQNVTLVQAETMPLAGVSLDQTPAPSTYDTPRSVHTVLRGSRINYCPNPSFETSLSGWTGIGSATLTRDTTTVYGINGTLPYLDYASGTASMRVRITAAADGAVISVSQLLTGFTYIASLHALPGAGLRDIRLQVGQTAGGIPTATTLPLSTSQWYRPRVIFTATSPTVNLAVFGVPLATASTGGYGGTYGGTYGGGGPATFPLTFWVDAVLVEEGDALLDYFDGDSGNPDYQWEGTQGLTRSYHYPEYAVGKDTVDDILNRHIPVGLTPAAPLYITPPSQ